VDRGRTRLLNLSLAGLAGWCRSSYSAGDRAKTRLRSQGGFFFLPAGPRGGVGGLFPAPFLDIYYNIYLSFIALFTTEPATQLPLHSRTGRHTDRTDDDPKRFTHGHT